MGKMIKKNVKNEKLFLDYIATFAGALSKAFIIAFVLCFIYLTAVFFGKNVRYFDTLSPKDQEYFANVLKYISKILIISGFGSIILATLAYLKESLYSRILFILGIIFVYGLPWGMYYLTPKEDFHNVPFLTFLVGSYIKLGQVALVIGAVLLFKDIIIDIRRSIARLSVQSKVNARSKVKKKVYFKTMGLNTKCWETVYCSPELRAICPAAKRKTNCWKLGTGCCDETMFLIAGDSGYSKKLLEMVKPVSNPVAQAEKCKKCHVFMTHQRHKYKVLSPLIVILSLVLGTLLYEPLVAYAKKAVLSADRFVSFLVTSPNTATLSESNSTLMFLVFMMVVVVVISVMTVATSILNYCVFKLKI